jgi:hypothetical protein
MGVSRPARSRSAVHDQRRATIGVAPGLPVHEVAVPHIEQPAVIRLRLGIDRRSDTTHHVAGGLMHFAAVKKSRQE